MAGQAVHIALEVRFEAGFIFGGFDIVPAMRVIARIQRPTAARMRTKGGMSHHINVDGREESILPGIDNG